MHFVIVNSHLPEKEQQKCFVGTSSICPHRKPDEQGNIFFLSQKQKPPVQTWPPWAKLVSRIFFCPVSGSGQAAQPPELAPCERASSHFLHFCHPGCQVCIKKAADSDVLPFLLKAHIQELSVMLGFLFTKAYFRLQVTSPMCTGTSGPLLVCQQIGHKGWWCWPNNGFSSQIWQAQAHQLNQHQAGVQIGTTGRYGGLVHWIKCCNLFSWTFLGGHHHLNMSWWCHPSKQNLCLLLPWCSHPPWKCPKWWSPETQRSSPNWIGCGNGTQATAHHGLAGGANRHEWKLTLWRLEMDHLLSPDSSRSFVDPCEVGAFDSQHSLAMGSGVELGFKHSKSQNPSSALQSTPWK